MNNPEKNPASTDSRQLTELHDKASHVCELLKVMSNEWRLIILCQLSEGDKTVGELQDMLALSQSPCHNISRCCGERRSSRPASTDSR